MVDTEPMNESSDSCLGFAESINGSRSGVNFAVMSPVTLKGGVGRTDSFKMSKNGKNENKVFELRSRNMSPNYNIPGDVDDDFKDISTNHILNAPSYESV